MKRIFIFAVVWAACLCNADASSADPEYRSSLEQLRLQGATKVDAATRIVPYEKNLWRKLRYSVIVSSSEIKEPNTPLGPIAARIYISLDLDGSKPATLAAAKNAKSFPKSIYHPLAIKLEYEYQSGKWVFMSDKNYFSFVNRSSPVQIYADQLDPEGDPIDWVIAQFMPSDFVPTPKPPPAPEIKHVYLFDVLKKPTYKTTWDRLIAGEKNVPDWLRRYGDSRNGVASPMESATLSNGLHQSYSVCKAHDCPSSSFIVLFAPDGKKAWGLLFTARTDIRFFGNPDDEKKGYLRDATDNM